MDRQGNSVNQCHVELFSPDKTRRALILEKVAVFDDEGYDGSFITFNLGDVIQKYRTWERALPRIKPFYAIKCNDDKAVLKVLADLGASFDCASKVEMQSILDLGVSPSRIIYANPCKQISMLKYAVVNDVVLMTFDNETELHRIKKFSPGARLVVRIRPSISFDVEIDLRDKFGCDKSEAVHLFQIARRLGLNVVGVSFHVGTGCRDIAAFSATIREAREVFDIGENMGVDMQLLDIGGGFPGLDSVSPTFEEMAVSINEALNQYFPEQTGLEIIAEPGTYFVQSICTLGVQIMSKRTRIIDTLNADVLGNKEDDIVSMIYYINDGMYGTLHDPCLDEAARRARVLTFSNGGRKYNSTIWGPTCDSIDCVVRNIQLPDLKVGQWLYFENMGAYTFVCSTSFNGMPPPKRCYLCMDQLWYTVYPTAIATEAEKEHFASMLVSRKDSER